MAGQHPGGHPNGWTTSGRSSKWLEDSHSILEREREREREREKDMGSTIKRNAISLHKFSSKVGSRKER